VGLRGDNHLCEYKYPQKLFKETASPKEMGAVPAVPCGHHFSLLHLVTFSCSGAGCSEEKALKACYQQAVVTKPCIHVPGGLLLLH